MQAFCRPCRLDVSTLPHVARISESPSHFQPAIARQLNYQPSTLVTSERGGATSKVFGKCAVRSHMSPLKGPANKEREEHRVPVSYFREILLGPLI